MLVFLLLFQRPFFSCALGPLRDSPRSLSAQLLETEAGEMAGVVTNGQFSLFHFFSPASVLLFQFSAAGLGYVDFLVDDQGDTIFVASSAVPYGQLGPGWPDADHTFFDVRGNLLYQIHAHRQDFSASHDRRAFAILNLGQSPEREGLPEYEVFRASDGMKIRNLKREDNLFYLSNGLDFTPAFLFLDAVHSLHANRQSLAMESPVPTDRWFLPFLLEENPHRQIDGILALDSQYLGILFWSLDVRESAMDQSQRLVILEAKTGQRIGELSISKRDDRLQPFGWAVGLFPDLNLGICRKRGEHLVFHENGPTLLILEKLDWSASGPHSLFQRAVCKLVQAPKAPNVPNLLGQIGGRWGISFSEHSLSYLTF
jgi:hypothetical protein